MGCDVKSNNGNLEISGDCRNVTIGTSWKKFGKAQNNEIGDKLKETQNPIIITGDVKGNINSKSKNVTITRNIPSGKEVESRTGNIEIGGNNGGEIESRTGNIEIDGNNSGKIGSRTGNIKIDGNNSGEIESRTGKVTIGEDIFYIKRNGFNISGSDPIIRGSGNVIINGSSKGNIATNGDVIINGVKQESGKDTMEVMLVINNVQINISNKVIIINGREESLNDARKKGYNINDDFSEVIFDKQKISIHPDGIKIKAI